MADFDIDRFVELSRAVDTSDLDWDEAVRAGVTDDEHRCLRYMADVESHTILYMRDLLAGHTSHDPEVTAFLSCWVYEEFQHGRAIDKFLTACGRPPSRDQFHRVSTAAHWQEAVEAFLCHAAAFLTPHFMATHMAWGAINELCAAAAYGAVARRTKNRPLSILLSRMAQDERRHFSFYYHQAEKRLAASPVARAICQTALTRFWSMVGVGVGDETSDTMDFLFAAYFNSPRGAEELESLDRTVRRLPGLSWWGRIADERNKALERYSRKWPERYRQLIAAELAWETNHRRAMAQADPPTAAAAAH